MLFVAVTELTCFDGPSRNAPFAPISRAGGDGQSTPAAVAPGLAYDSDSSSEVDAELMQTTAPAAWKRRLATPRVR